MEGVITKENAGWVRQGQTVFDRAGDPVGKVEDLDRATGWMTILPIELNPLSIHPLYVPFKLVIGAQARNLDVSVTRQELEAGYAIPPQRSTAVEDLLGEPVARTRQPSGYDGEPVVVQETKLNDVRHLIARGDVVLSAQMTELGYVKQYDPSSGWIVIGDRPQAQHDLVVPLSVVGFVRRDANEVYLALSETDLERLQHLEPAKLTS